MSKPDLEASTPFLILFDEIWFREYGPGEVLRAELALEDREIGETDADKRPARLGPLPTKHVVARWDAKHPKVWTDEDAEQEPALRLQCYGPFGYSLDRTGNEALANATAFVVYVPDKLWKIGPQWSAFVRFRRVLHSLSSNGARAALPAEIVGGLSGVYPLYTLADSAQLAMPTAIAEPGLHTARLETQAGKTVLTSDELLFNLSPYHRDGAPAPTEVQNQFRYLLLMGRGGIDGGRGVEVFLPEHAYWVRQDLTITAMGPGTDTINPDARWTRGQILEIELDTITPPDQKAGGTVDMAGDLRDVFRAMLPEPDKSTKVHESDSPGRISRVSAIFAWNSVEFLPI